MSQKRCYKNGVTQKLCVFRNYYYLNNHSISEEVALLHLHPPPIHPKDHKVDIVK